MSLSSSNESPQQELLCNLFNLTERRCIVMISILFVELPIMSVTVVCSNRWSVLFT